MQLFTINATSWRDSEDDSYNNALFDIMPEVVSRMLKGYGIDGFTIYEVIGFWEGKRERSYRIEVLTELSFDDMAGLCEALRDYYNQDSVILQCGENVKFVERP